MPMDHQDGTAVATGASPGEWIQPAGPGTARPARRPSHSPARRPSSLTPTPLGLPPQDDPGALLVPFVSRARRVGDGRSVEPMGTGLGASMIGPGLPTRFTRT